MLQVMRTMMMHLKDDGDALDGDGVDVGDSPDQANIHHDIDMHQF